MRQKIEILFEEVKRLEEAAGQTAHKSKSDANELSAGLVSSYSLAGDVEHAKNTANLSIQKYSVVKKLFDELQKSLDTEVPEKIRTVSYVLAKYTDNGEKELYFVDNPVFINEFNLISIDFPLGKSLNGNKIGERFSYTSGGQEFEGEILSIG